MLYVSRCVTRPGTGMALTKYGVVDTEDGIEELYSWTQLASLMQSPFSSPIEIKGVECQWKSGIVNGRRMTWASSVRISVYEGPGTLPRSKITTA